MWAPATVFSYSHPWQRARRMGHPHFSGQIGGAPALVQWWDPGHPRGKTSLRAKL